MASGIYNSFIPKSLTTAAGHTLKVALLNGYSFVATHNTYANLTDEVASGGGYTTGGKALVSPTVSTVAANSWTRAWAANTAFTLGQIVKPVGAGNGYIYRCVVAGTSHSATEPTWPTTIGTTVADNASITWLNVGTYVITLTATNPAWTTATITADGCAVYDTEDSDQLIAYQAFTVSTTSTNGTFTITTFGSNEGILDVCK